MTFINCGTDGLINIESILHIKFQIFKKKQLIAIESKGCYVDHLYYNIFFLLENGNTISHEHRIKKYRYR